MPSPARHDVRRDSRQYPGPVIAMATGNADNKHGNPEFRPEFRPELGTDTHNRGDPRDLRARLADLPSSHPSAAGYVRDQPAVRRPGSSAQPDNPAPATEASSGERTGSDLPRRNAAPDYARNGDIRLTTDRRSHILDGDETGGGHRHGVGEPGKTEFPAEWDDHYIIDAVLTVARKPDQTPERQNWNGRWHVDGKHDGVGIVAIVQPDGHVWTAWPREGSPGVVKNALEDAR